MQEYKNGRIVVRFNEYLCGHAGECVRGLPLVFDPSRDPWIDVSAASPEAIADVIRRCPTGALECDPIK
jgi:uncharacterized Fe-S cluster protein YjdI